MTLSHQHIAAACGLSRATVSRALRNDPRLRPETIARVKQVATRLGYRPNPLVSTLMEHIRTARPVSFSGKLAVVSGHRDPLHWDADVPTWQRIHAGARARAAERGYELDYFSTAHFPANGRRLSDILRARGIHGVYLTPRRQSEPHPVNLRWPDFSVVTTGYSTKEPNFHRVCHQNFHAVTLACAKLRAAGYRRPGLALLESQMANTDFQYHAGFLIFREQLPARDHVPVCDYSEATNWRDRFVAWFQRYRPDAIMGAHEGIVQWLRELGQRVPEDVGFVHLDWSPPFAGCAGVDHHGELIGAAAIDLLVAQIQRYETGVPQHPITSLVEGHWIDGPTVRAAGTPSVPVAAGGRTRK
jgi:LacI family transcriptional regulator